MNFTLLHLYPEAMSLYGEYANLSLLARLLSCLGDQAEIRPVLMDDAPDFSGADLIYMGAGTERMAKAALARLLPHADAMAAALNRGALVFFTGTAMPLLGASVTDKDGKIWTGLGFADYVTTESDRRTPHDVIARTDLWPAPAVGFMNKCSVTAGIDAPLFTALDRGFGNEARQGAEGYRAGNLLATHLTGPILVKNPAFLRYVARRLYEAKGAELPALQREEPWLRHAALSYAVTYGELRGQKP